MKDKKTLLLINGSQFGYSSGHYFYCKYLKDCYNIFYICYDRGLNKMQLDGVTVKYIDFKVSKFKRMFEFVKAGISESHKIKPDILFVVYFNLSFFLSMFGKGKSKILDIRTGSLKKNRVIRKLNNSLIKWQSLFFKKKIILSESLRLKLKISSKNTLVLPLGSEVYFEGTHQYENLHLLYVGTFDGRNLSDTLKGLSIYLEEFSNRKDRTLYTIIGFGSEAEESKIKTAIEILNLTPNVRYEGRKNYEELAPYFKEGNIGVSYVPMTDFYDLQPPTKTFEYILSGLFTIATGTYENKQFITNVNGIICDDNATSFADSVANCYDSRASFKSEKIRNSLVEYKWDSLIKNKLLPFLN